MKSFFSLLALGLGSSLIRLVPVNAGIIAYGGNFCGGSAGADVICDGRCIDLYGRNSFKINATDVNTYCVKVYSEDYCKSATPSQSISIELPGVCTTFGPETTDMHRWVACTPALLCV
ncbi:hypothetical protein CPB84DRAFT_1794198 [Gymnopilus junonius]|uniref:Uncharacterized protein n=1 Tax=Gymnopilus junonius TaxID=109634 RepID=A0A9P5NC95_GYMJU|nr:hypothetical protein CPB84DRAFT_1794198 [Gymnopilus junonius]